MERAGISGDSTVAQGVLIGSFGKKEEGLHYKAQRCVACV